MISRIVLIITIVTIYLFLSQMKSKINIEKFEKLNFNEIEDCVELYPKCINGLCYYKCIKYLFGKRTEIFIWNA